VNIEALQRYRDNKFMKKNPILTNT